jgi:hypothetical protein
MINSTSGVTGIDEIFMWFLANAVGHSALTNFGVTEDAIQFYLVGTEQLTTTLDKLNGYSLFGATKIIKMSKKAKKRNPKKKTIKSKNL